jgi:hypothetical protein
MACYNILQQTQHLLIPNNPAVKLHQYLMVYVGKIFPYITFQRILKPSGKLARPLHSVMSALAFPAGEAVLNKAFFKKRLDYPYHGVMNYPVAKISRRDGTPLRLVYLEIMVAAVLILTAEQLLSKQRDLPLHIRQKFRRRSLASLAFNGFKRGGVKIRKRTNIIK